MAFKVSLTTFDVIPEPKLLVALYHDLMKKSYLKEMIPFLRILQFYVKEAAFEEGGPYMGYVSRTKEEAALQVSQPAGID